MPRLSLIPLIGASLLLGGSVSLGLPSAAGAATVLYTLKTECSLAGAAPMPCTVEAEDQGTVTLYRYRLGKEERIIGISEEPYVRMGLWNAASRGWQALSSASARLSTNTVCFNGTDLCAVNPNYLNSLRQSRGAALNGRDLIKVTFGSDGRINAYCYDDGCPSPGGR